MAGGRRKQVLPSSSNTQPGALSASAEKAAFSRELVRYSHEMGNLAFTRLSPVSLKTLLRVAVPFAGGTGGPTPGGRHGAGLAGYQQEPQRASQFAPAPPGEQTVPARWPSRKSRKARATTEICRSAG